MTQKTNAARLLDQLGIHDELREYDVDPADLAADSCCQDWPAARKFSKRWSAPGDRRGFCMAIIPGDTELDLKALAAASGDRRIYLVPVKEWQKLTGYIRGEVTALAARKGFPIYVDKSIQRFEAISISAGIRGLQILLAPGDYLKAAKATLVPTALTKG
jgi:Cys-tRNA(Pro)/Cys-tRNA(Cys) deacylase